MPTAAELFDTALRHHQNGNLQEAAALYRQIIQAEPAHAAAHHMLGFLAHQTGHQDVAIALIRRAIAFGPAVPEFHFNLGAALKAKGHLDEAAQCYEQALALNSRYIEAHINLGNIRALQRRLPEAADCMRRALEINPAHAGIHNNLGILLKDLGDLAGAADAYREALRHYPEYADAHYNLGILLKEQGRLDEAIACYRQALACNPQNADAWNNLGNALKEQGRLAEAADCYREAVHIRPEFADAHNNLGLALEEQGLADVACASYLESIRLSPQHADPHHNLSVALTRQGMFQAALERNAEALRLDPSLVLALWQRALLHLLMGDFAQGWRDYEIRWKLADAPPRLLAKPEWDGSGFTGKTLLVCAEQGLGDTIQFARYLPLVKERGGTVVFECQPALTGLCSRLAGVDHVIVGGTALPPFDMQIPLSSLPSLFHTTLESIPGRVPYLFADKRLVEYWAKELAPLSALKVGIAWQGNPENKGDRYRSVPLAHFKALCTESVRLFSLQVGHGLEQLATAALPIDDLGSRFDASLLDDLAAALVNLDLVVTIESAVAHLAGALGVPVWTVLPVSSDWRWLLERADSPWYSTMRLFRQKRLGEWNDVLAEVAKRLRELPVVQR